MSIRQLCSGGNICEFCFLSCTSSTFVKRVYSKSKKKWIQGSIIFSLESTSICRERNAFCLLPPTKWLNFSPRKWTLLKYFKVFFQKEFILEQISVSSPCYMNQDKKTYQNLIVYFTPAAGSSFLLDIHNFSQFSFTKIALYDNMQHHSLLFFSKIECTV